MSATHSALRAYLIFISPGPLVRLESPELLCRFDLTIQSGPGLQELGGVGGNSAQETGPVAATPLRSCIRRSFISASYALSLWRAFHLSRIVAPCSSSICSVTGNLMLSRTFSTTDMWFACGLSSRNRDMRHRPWPST